MEKILIIEDEKDVTGFLHKLYKMLDMKHFLFIMACIVKILEKNN